MLKNGKGKASFDGVKTMFLKLNSNQVKLSYILEYIRTNCGEEYSVVTNEGMELEESSVTEGICSFTGPKQ